MVIKTYKIMSLPNKKQQTRLFQFANAARFAYNWSIAREIVNHNDGNKFLSDTKLRKEFTHLIHTEFKWLEQISCDVTKQAIKDAVVAYRRFFKGLTKYPRFKKKFKSKPSFYQDNIKIQITGTHVKLTGLSSSKRRNRQKFNWIRFAEKDYVPINVKYHNPRVSYDGLHWWLTVGVEIPEIVKPDISSLNLSNGIGIDIGIKDLAVTSDGKVYENINKTKQIRNLEKRKARLQRSVSRKYRINKKGESYCKTKNIIKRQKELLKLQKRLNDIRYNYIQQVSSDIIKRKPSFICMEDLNVTGMLKNRHLAKAIQQQLLGEFYKMVNYKTDWSGVWFVTAYRYFPSSKMCYLCKTIKKDLKLSDRVYHCICGNVIDRDYQASINLRDYGADELAGMLAG